MAERQLADAHGVLNLHRHVEQGDQVVLIANGDDAQSAMNELVPLLEGDLG